MRRLSPRLAACLIAVASLALVAPAGAQPFGGFMVTSGDPASAYVHIPPSPSLDTGAGFTFEAWVAISNSSSAQDCRSIAGKNYLQAWWVGLCTVGGKPTLRSYLKGGASARDGGIIPAGQWTHIAVVFDGSTRKHYINGEEVYSVAETGTLPASASEMRIGSDVSWEHTPTGSIDEVRLWWIARTRDQLRAWINRPLSGIQNGLVGNWRLDGNAQDVLGLHHGTNAGASFLTSPVAPSCTPSPTSLCLHNRFAVSVTWRDNAGVVSDGRVVPGIGTPQSGLFYFINDENWELLAKMVDGCGLNSRYWVFVSGSTELFYRLAITDVTRGVNKIYFSYSGTNPPAITDTDAFATCP